MSSRALWVFILAFVLVFLGIVGFSTTSDKYYFARSKTYSIPAGSMKPTLQIGDNFLVQRAFKFLGEEYSPQRGDIIVFYNEKANTDYVKRLVGLPGERIQLKNGEIFIDDVAVDRIRTEDYVEDRGSDGQLKINKFRETLPNGRFYEILEITENGRMDNTKEYEVPDGHLFVLGDNRDNSVDSRMLSHTGFVPIAHVVGVVRHVYYSGVDEEFVWRSVVAEQEAD